MKQYVHNEYFDWLNSLVNHNRYSQRISYLKLLIHLHDTDFRYSIPRDSNRAEDGKNMRYHFAMDRYPDDVDRVMDILEGPCSVLEMMIGLAVRGEEIMDDPAIGDRTAQWFWSMVTNLGLGSMHDTIYDEKYVDMVIDRFLDREYEPDGRGGLFRVRGSKTDLRTVEIWYQLCWYLNTIT